MKDRRQPPHSPGCRSDLLGAASDFDFHGGDCFLRAAVREAAGRLGPLCSERWSCWQAVWGQGAGAKPGLLLTHRHEEEPGSARVHMGGTGE